MFPVCSVADLPGSYHPARLRRQVSMESCVWCPRTRTRNRVYVVLVLGRDDLQRARKTNRFLPSRRNRRRSRDRTTSAAMELEASSAGTGS
jgi:hypothetical protein